MQIHVALCDLTELPVDAIITPTNSQGLMSHGVAAQVRAIGGKDIEDEARDAAPIAVGAAVVTTGGELYAKHVIHVPTTEDPGGKPTIESVRRATRAALVAAAAKGFDVIAMPPMCSHTPSVPFDETARAMVDELRAHKQNVPQQVYLVSLKQEMIFAYEEALRNAFIPG